jgi:hypothetical protein
MFGQINRLKRGDFSRAERGGCQRFSCIIARSGHFASIWVRPLSNYDYRAINGLPQSAQAE